MIFGPKNQLVGLDIGSRAIKAAESVQTKNGWELKKFGSIDIEPGAIEEGVIKNADALLNAVKQLFDLYNFKTKNVSVSIGGYSVIVKNINMQKMPEEQLADSLSFEAEQYIPFDINDVNIDFQMLGENEQNPNQMNVLLVAAKKDMINEYINLIDNAQLNLCIIDIDAFALQNIYEANYGVQNENVALIDIGASKTSVNILKGNTSVFLRDVSLGCNQISEKIASIANCSLAEADTIRQQEASDKISPDNLKKVVSSVVNDWCDEIGRALDFFKSTNPDEEMKQVFLSGGGANIKEFRELLAMQTSVEVNVINPFEKFSIGNDQLDIGYIKQIAPQAAIAMGLSLRRVDDK